MGSVLQLALAASSAVPTFQPVAISGGGFVVGIDIASDGSIVARTDTYSCYLGSTTPGTKWQQIVSANSMPAGYAGFSSGGILISNSFGAIAEEIVSAPGNSSLLYMFFHGAMFKSTNKGTTWAQLTGFTPLTNNADLFPADGYRQNQQKMAVDPNNSNVVLLGTKSAGLWYTTDGGVTWTQVSTGSVPISAQDSNGVYGGITGVCFDPGSGTTGGNTNTAYVAVFGHGVYQTTTTVSGTWALLASSPQYVESAFVTQGDYFTCSATSSSGVTGTGAATLLQQYNGSWSTLTSNGIGIHVAAVNPNNSTNIVYMNIFGYCGQSNGFNSWTATYATLTVSAAYVPWLASIYGTNLGDIGSLVFDPNVTNRIWVSTGGGVLYTDSFTSATLSTSTNIAWKDSTLGISNMVTTTLCSPPGGVPIFGVRDHQFFVGSSLTAQPTNFGIGVHQASIIAGWGVDYAKSSPSTVAALVDGIYAGFNQDASGISSNGGGSFLAFGAAPFNPASFNGCALAAATPTNICALSNNNQSGAIVETQNGGGSWSAPTGLPTSGWPANTSGNYQVLCADASGNFYAYNSTHGLYRSTNGGAAWSQIISTNIDASYFQPTLTATPGQTGHLWYTLGANVGSSQPTTTALYFTENSSSWSTVANVENVACVGFGATYPGQNYPTVWIVGWVTGGLVKGVVVNTYTWGLWVCKNFNPATASGSWTWLIDWPNGSFDYPVCIAGDGNDYTKCYIGYLGSSYIFGSNLVY